MSRNNLTRTLRNRYDEQARLQEQLATGRKLTKSSEDPSSFGMARRLDVVIRQNDQFTRSIESAIDWTNSTQATLDGISNLMTSVYEEGIRGANDSMDADARTRIGERVDKLLDELLDRLNTKTPDGYLFAGSNTTEKPFVLDNAAGSDAAGVSYTGNADPLERAVGVDSRMNVGIAGSRMTSAGGAALTGAVAGLRDALLANDSGAMEAALEGVIAARDQAINLTAEIGVAAERLNSMRDQVASTNLRVIGQRSALEDANLAETVSEIQKGQMGLQAALQAISTIYQTSILNYLR
jgi:flagellar hook-associated protein 3 FlgL